MQGPAHSAWFGCTDHLPIAEEEVHVLLLEPKTTLNTGNVRNERTVATLERI